MPQLIVCRPGLSRWTGRALGQRRQSNNSVDHMFRKIKTKIEVAFLCFQMAAVAGYAATSSPLFSRGYTVLPAPQKVSLGAKDFELTRAWRLELGPGVKPDDI